METFVTLVLIVDVRHLILNHGSTVICICWVSLFLNISHTFLFWSWSLAMDWTLYQFWTTTLIGSLIQVSSAHIHIFSVVFLWTLASPNTWWFDWRRVTLVVCLITTNIFDNIEAISCGLMFVLFSKLGCGCWLIVDLSVS